MQAEWKLSIKNRWFLRHKRIWNQKILAKSLHPYENWLLLQNVEKIWPPNPQLRFHRDRRDYFWWIDATTDHKWLHCVLVAASNKSINFWLFKRTYLKCNEAEADDDTVLEVIEAAEAVSDNSFWIGINLGLDLCNIRWHLSSWVNTQETLMPTEVHLANRHFLQFFRVLLSIKHWLAKSWHTVTQNQ